MRKGLTLGISGFDFSDLFCSDGLSKLLTAFEKQLAKNDEMLFKQYQDYQFFYAKYAGTKSALDNQNILEKNEPSSDFLCQLAREVSGFIGELFGKETQERIKLIQKQTQQQKILIDFKESFIKKRLKLHIALIEKTDISIPNLSSIGIEESFNEVCVAKYTLTLLEKEKALQKDLSFLNQRQVVSQYIEIIGKFITSQFDILKNQYHWQSLVLPTPTNYHALIPIKTKGYESVLIENDVVLPTSRNGFNLTEPLPEPNDVIQEASYCLHCHKRNKDSCSKGLFDKGQKLKNPLGNLLEGCPLKEKISEAQMIRNEGDPIGALALICLDNPLCPGTGHRICNDCSKSCIFQKQTPVNVPLFETGVLAEVLSIPYGAEIYGLLTRWNPLSIERPHLRPYNGKNVLVVGLGPAGYTLTHHLAKSGFGVVAIDGTNIIPIEKNSFITPHKKTLYQPIRDFYKDFHRPLTERIVTGFGGVSEYGITHRFDKNFLSLIQLTLERQQGVLFKGSIRFGGTITIEDAFKQGFDHIALATGAGSPVIPEIKNNLVQGMRIASDFLMNLHLAKPYRIQSTSNLDIQLPAVVIGGGLTAVDTATEILAYYEAQIEKLLYRYNSLIKNDDGVICTKKEASFWAMFNNEEKITIQQQLDHANQLAQAKYDAYIKQQPFNAKLLHESWGGVTIVYRNSFLQSPAYRINHEELHKGLHSGIRWVSGLMPQKVQVDALGQLKSILFWDSSTHDQVEIPCKNAFLATGSNPNAHYADEHHYSFEIAPNGYFATHQLRDGQLVKSPNGFFTSYKQRGRYITVFGDSHPVFQGSVVKAMASAQQGYKIIEQVLYNSPPLTQTSWDSFKHEFNKNYTAILIDKKYIADKVLELVIHAPYQAKKFLPGLFYKLQNKVSDDKSSFEIEGLALTGAKVDKHQGLITLVVLEIGLSSKLCNQLEVNQEVSLMGPTGSPSVLPFGQKVTLIGGGLGNAVLISLAKALQEQGCFVTYFAGYRHPKDRFYQQEIEASADHVVWSFETMQNAEKIACRPQDFLYQGSIIDALIEHDRYCATQSVQSPLANDHWFVIGSHRMMQKVQELQKNRCANKLSSGQVASINSPMQCMMKGVCGQCVQKMQMPNQEQSYFIFSCSNQDQPLAQVDFSFLHQRLSQNSIQEKISNYWFLKTTAPSADK